MSSTSAAFSSLFIAPRRTPANKKPARRRAGDESLAPPAPDLRIAGGLRQGLWSGDGSRWPERAALWLWLWLPDERVVSALDQPLAAAASLGGSDSAGPSPFPDGAPARISASRVREVSTRIPGPMLVASVIDSR